MGEAVKLGRPRKFDEAKALDSIMNVFWEKGFEGTSLSDLMEATGLQKGSLYGAFGDKRAMYLKALDCYSDRWTNSLIDKLTGQGEPLPRVARFLQSAVDGVVGHNAARGCFMCNAAIDQAGIVPNARHLVQASLKRLEAALADVVAELTGDSAPQQASQLLSVYFGLRVLAKGGANAAILSNAKQSALQSLVDAANKHPGGNLSPAG